MFKKGQFVRNIDNDRIFEVRNGIQINRRR